ncbi:unnamed protein product [Meloidogyne enterolobii]|uniref:Uncharacterized protein n=1 Tax=Meloidogyne enterolobii TaxID=390850 RepID=A0ACB0Y8H6_MELEN
MKSFPSFPIIFHFIHISSSSPPFHHPSNLYILFSPPFPPCLCQISLIAMSANREGRRNPAKSSLPLWPNEFCFVLLFVVNI